MNNISLAQLLAQKGWVLESRSPTDGHPVSWLLAKDNQVHWYVKNVLDLIGYKCEIDEDSGRFFGTLDGEPIDDLQLLPLMTMCFYSDIYIDHKGELRINLDMFRSPIRKPRDSRVVPTGELLSRRLRNRWNADTRPEM